MLIYFTVTFDGIENAWYANANSIFQTSQGAGWGLSNQVLHLAQSGALLL